MITKESQNKAVKFWDRIAKSYDKEEKKDEKTQLDIIEKVKDYLKPEDVVLDFGCGTGLVSNRIAGSVKKINAIDISSGMIENAKLKTKAREIHNIEYTQTTLFNNRLKTGTFDIILAFYILHLVEDTNTVIQRIHQLLKPGGLLISATPCMGEKMFLSYLFSILGKIKVIPKIKSFVHYDLVKLQTDENFDIIKTEQIVETSNQYFFVAKKIII